MEKKTIIEKALQKFINERGLLQAMESYNKMNKESFEDEMTCGESMLDLNNLRCIRVDSEKFTNIINS